MDGLRLDTTVYDIANWLGGRLSEILGGHFELKALGHHIEVYSPKGTAIVDLYPRGRYILMRLYGPLESRQLVTYRPRKLEDGTTRYMILIPGVKFKKPPEIRHGRLNVFGYVRRRNALYLVTAHRSHMIIAQEAAERYFRELNDDAVLYGNFDTSGRTPAFTIKKLSPDNALVHKAQKVFGITPQGCLEARGSGTVAAIYMAYSHAETLGVDRLALLEQLVKTGNIRQRKRRFLK